MTVNSRSRVLIVFGGRSSEHEVSCATAAGILTAIDRTKWDVIPLGITRDGQWVRVADDPCRCSFSFVSHAAVFQHAEEHAMHYKYGVITITKGLDDVIDYLEGTIQRFYMHNVETLPEVKYVVFVAT